MRLFLGFHSSSRTDLNRLCESFFLKSSSSFFIFSSSCFFCFVFCFIFFCFFHFSFHHTIHCLVFLNFRFMGSFRIMNFFPKYSFFTQILCFLKKRVSCFVSPLSYHIFSCLICVFNRFPVAFFNTVISKIIYQKFKFSSKFNFEGI